MRLEGTPELSAIGTVNPQRPVSPEYGPDRTAHTAWDDPVRRVVASLEEAGVPIAQRRLGGGEAVYEAGDPDTRLFFLLSGEIRVYKRYGRRDCKEATVALLKDRSVFGEPTLRPDGWHRDCAEAASACSVATVRKSALARHLEHDPGCALALLFAYCSWARSREAAIARLVPREVRGRLAHLLLELDAGPRPVKIRTTHQRLAEMVACSREAVSKELGILRREGILGEGSRGNIVVQDRRTLADIAEVGYRSQPDVSSRPDLRPRVLPLSQSYRATS